MTFMEKIKGDYYDELFAKAVAEFKRLRQLKEQENLPN